MFLSDTTIRNIQNRLNTQILRNDVRVVAIHQHRGELIVRLKLDGEDIACVIESKEGRNLADGIADAVRWEAYYRMAEIYAGLECDDEAERIQALWPQDQGANVTILRPQEVAPTQTFTRDLPGARVTAKSEPRQVVSTRDIDALNQKFGGRRK